MINDYIIDINLPVNFIPYEFTKSDHFQELVIIPEMINNDFHLWLKDIGLKICPVASRFFIRPFNMQGSIHVDSYSNHASKINLIYDSIDSVMHWYNLLPGKTATSLVNYRKEVIKSYNPQDCEKVLTTPANKHCLINGKMIHRIDTGKNNYQFRKCYSLLLLDNNNKRISWDEALKIFKPYLIFK